MPNQQQLGSEIIVAICRTRRIEGLLALARGFGPVLTLVANAPPAGRSLTKPARHLTTQESGLVPCLFSPPSTRFLLYVGHLSFPRLGFLHPQSLALRIFWVGLQVFVHICIASPCRSIPNFRCCDSHNHFSLYRPTAHHSSHFIVHLPSRKKAVCAFASGICYSICCRNGPPAFCSWRAFAEGKRTPPISLLKPW